MQKEKEELLMEMKRVIESHYTQMTSLAHAVLDIMKKAPNARVQLDLLAFVLENFCFVEMKTGQNATCETLMSEERFCTLEKELKSEIETAVNEITKQIMNISLEKLARKVYRSINKYSDREKQDFVLALFMGSKITPWKFLKGSVNISEEEWRSLITSQRADTLQIISTITGMTSGRIKFKTVTDMSSYFLGLIDKHSDQKVRTVLMACLIEGIKNSNIESPLMASIEIPVKEILSSLLRKTRIDEKMNDDSNTGNA